METLRSPFSVLDRLLDDHPDRLRDVPLPDARSVAMARDAIRRDLEALLNATKPWLVPSAHQTQLGTSPLGYGLADVTAGVLSSAAERERIRADVEATITRFEPRLDAVRVTLLPDEAPLSAVIPLCVEAVMLHAPEPEFIRYSTAIMLSDEPVSVRPMRGD